MESIFIGASFYAGLCYRKGWLRFRERGALERTRASPASVGALERWSVGALERTRASPASVGAGSVGALERTRASPASVVAVFGVTHKILDRPDTASVTPEIRAGGMPTP